VGADAALAAVAAALLAVTFDTALPVVLAAFDAALLAVLATFDAALLTASEAALRAF
jgi:hypothetical protein